MNSRGSDLGMKSSTPMSAYACPCCGFLTLDEPPPGTFNICPVCYWEDDPVQFAEPSLPSGANIVPLAEARRNFLGCGAASPEFLCSVRPPRDGERPK